MITHHILFRRTAVTGFFCALFPVSGAAFAQGYPVKPIRLVVPFAPGGAADIVARTLSPRLSEVAGQQVVVDNRAGANGVIGVDAVAKAQPDGYTFVLTTVGSLAITPHLQEKMPFNALRDLTPVTLAVKNPLVLVAHAAVPVKSVSELVHLASARGARLTSGSSGTGSINHLALEQLKLLTGASITHVAYKGEGPAMTDLVGGQIDLMVVTLLVAQPFIQAGRIRALGALGERRPLAMPELQTLAEAGVKGYQAEAWLGLLGPAGLSRELVGRVGNDWQRVIKDTDVRQSLVARGSDPAGTSPEEFAIYLRSEFERYGNLVRKAHVTLE